MSEKEINVLPYKQSLKRKTQCLRRERLPEVLSFHPFPPPKEKKKSKITPNLKQMESSAQ